MAFKSSILEILSSLLSSNNEIRGAAEERKKAVEVRQDYCTVLLEVVREVGLEADEERLMAAILFKQYVKGHWSENVENYTPPELDNEQKDIIRIILPATLTDPNAAIQNHMCSVLAIIALSDYPEKWFDMPAEVLQRPHITGSDYAATLSFIEAFVPRALPSQLAPTVDVIFQFLFATFNNTRFDKKLQMDSIKITVEVICSHFRQEICLDMPKYSDAVTRFCAAFSSVILRSVSDDQDEIDLNCEVFNAYTVMLNNIPENVIEALANTLPSVWHLLILSANEFDRLLLSENTEMSDGYLCFYSIGYSIFDMLHALIKTELGRAFLTPVISDLLYFVILYMGIPKETEALWIADSNAWNSAEFQELYTPPSMRNKTKAFIKFLTTKFSPEVFMRGLWNAVEKHIEVCKTRYEAYGWRIAEAIMYSLASISRYVTSKHDRNKLYGFPIIDFLSEWATYATTCPSILTVARIMGVGGRYVGILNGPTAEIYLKATTSNLLNSSVILRYSAIRTFNWLFTFNKMYKYNIPIRLEIAGLLINAIKISHGPILQIGLTTLGLLITAVPPIVILIQEPLISMFRDFVSTNLFVPEIVYCSRGLIGELYSDPETRANFENAMFAHFESVFNSMKGSLQDKLTISAVCSRSIQIINSMVLMSPLPLDPRLVNIGFFGVYGCIQVCGDDDSVLINITECMQTFLLKTSVDLTRFRSIDGTSGLDVVLTVIKMVFTFKKMNEFAKEISHLCIAVIQSSNPLPTPIAHAMLQSTLSILQLDLTTEIRASIFSVLGLLFHSHIEPVLNYLSSMPGPQGESGLLFVLNKWIINICYDDNYQKNLNIVGLTKIIEHAVVKKDPRLIDIEAIEQGIQGVNPNQEDCGQARRDAVLDSILIRIIHFLLHFYLEETAGIAEPASPSEHYSDQSFKTLVETELEDLGGSCDSGVDQIGKDIDTCPFLSNDPLYNLDLPEYLVTYFNGLANNIHLYGLLGLLAYPEKETVRLFGINI